MTPKKILMACSNFWTSCFQVGSHHLAKEFIKLGYEVAFISDPISPLHLLKSSFLKERFHIYSTGGLSEENLWTYLPLTLIPPCRKPILQSEWVLRNWHKMTLPNVVRKVQDQGFGDVDILYFDTAVQSFWLDAIKARKTVFRMVDKNAGFTKTTKSQLKQEVNLSQNVDLVVCTAKNLIQGVKAKRLEHLPNGVSITHFSNRYEIPKEFQNLPKPIAIYVGSIEYWFDFALMEKLAKELPHISFVLIGPIKKNPFSNIKNIHLLGPKSYSSIPQYLQHADVGMIPFDVAHYPELIHNVNPLKLYEYMASGLPVVATCWDELKAIASPAFLSNGFEEFKRNLLHAIDHPNPEFYRQYAKEQDWKTRAQHLIKQLQ